MSCRSRNLCRSDVSPGSGEKLNQLRVGSRFLRRRQVSPVAVPSICTKLGKACEGGQRHRRKGEQHPGRLSLPVEISRWTTRMARRVLRSEAVEAKPVQQVADEESERPEGNV